MLTARVASELAPYHAGVVVPTMGALHPGHLTLIQRARYIADWEGVGDKGLPVIVTIFVNPTQFNDPADLTRYPRTPEADLAMCRDAGADVVFMPEVAEVYPGVGVRVPALPREATEPKLEDASRPGHFAGVCQVVLRLFELTRPRVACFGEKDWQQLRVISAMVDNERLAIRIVPVVTAREADGVALSSRNRFLGEEDRMRARAVPRALKAAQQAASSAEAEAAMRRELEAEGLVVEYAVVRDAATLLTPGTGQRRALIAARCGPVRLIDNARV